MSVNAFGIEHVSKADKPSKGRVVAGTALGPYHAAVAGKPGRKLGAVGSNFGHTLAGSAVGSVAGTVLTHGKPTGAKVGNLVGSLAGASRSVYTNQAKGRFKAEPTKSKVAKAGLGPGMKAAKARRGVFKITDAKNPRPTSRQVRAAAVGVGLNAGTNAGLIEGQRRIYNKKGAGVSPSGPYRHPVKSVRAYQASVGKAIDWDAEHQKQVLQANRTVASMPKADVKRTRRRGAALGGTVGGISGAGGGGRSAAAGAVVGAGAGALLGHAQATAHNASVDAARTNVERHDTVAKQAGVNAFGITHVSKLGPSAGRIVDEASSLVDGVKQGVTGGSGKFGGKGATSANAGASVGGMARKGGQAAARNKGALAVGIGAGAAGGAMAKTLQAPQQRQGPGW